MTNKQYQDALKIINASPAAFTTFFNEAILIYQSQAYSSRTFQDAVVAALEAHINRRLIGKVSDHPRQIEFPELEQ